MAISYKDALQSLFALERHGIKLGLETSTLLLSRLGHPEKTFQSFHIGGTNGKGSTSAILATILQAMGYRVGLYTSPHLVDFRERIRVQGQWISEGKLLDLIEHIFTVIPSHISPTFFEFTTALALKYFAQEQVDVAVIEVGMGGRFDATNVLTPVGVAITTISLDHEQYLGSTIEQVAGEKAGIIKAQIPLVIGSLDPISKKVIAAKAAAVEAPCNAYGEEFRVILRAEDTFDFYGMTNHWTNLSCSLKGEHQVRNAACALALLETMPPFNEGIQEPVVKQALASVRWDGRLEKVGTHPLLILDGAHNPESAMVLAVYLQEQREQGHFQKIVMIIGMNQDKDFHGFLKPLSPLAEGIIFTKIGVSSSASPQMLEASIGGQTVPTYLVPHPQHALTMAKEIAGPHDLICVTGSLYLVGEVKSLLNQTTFQPVRG